jgi:hypothetical protein
MHTQGNSSTASKNILRDLIGEAPNKGKKRDSKQNTKPRAKRANLDRGIDISRSDEVNTK